MNFNTMDLIKLKEAMCPSNHKDYEAISKFISWLIDIQAAGCEVGGKIEQALGSDFFKKQEMIEMAYKLTGMNFNFQNEEI